jgi:hypothetical protein
VSSNSGTLKKERKKKKRMDGPRKCVKSDFVISVFTESEHFQLVDVLYDSCCTAFSIFPSFEETANEFVLVFHTCSVAKVL